VPPSLRTTPCTPMGSDERRVDGGTRKGRNRFVLLIASGRRGILNVGSVSMPKARHSNYCDAYGSTIRRKAGRRRDQESASCRGLRRPYVGTICGASSAKIRWEYPAATPTIRIMSEMIPQLQRSVRRYVNPGALPDGRPNDVMHRSSPEKITAGGTIVIVITVILGPSGA